MTSVVAPQIKEKLLLVNSNYLRYSHVTNFIRCWQFRRSVHIQIRRSRGRLATMTGYEACTHII